MGAAAYAASTDAPANKAGGVTLTDYDVETGYWNVATGVLNSSLVTPGTQDAPAVQVTVRKTAGLNSGPVQLFFARVLGIGTSDVSATATAVTACPGVAYPGALFPIAIRKSVADQRAQFGSRTSTIKIGSDYHYPGDSAGQWTSFDVDANDVPFIRDLIQNGNPDTVTNLDSIWIQRGTRNTIYNEVPLEIDVALPVVLDADFQTHARVSVYGFIGFRITGFKKGAKPYVEGYFTSICISPKADPSAPATAPTPRRGSYSSRRDGKP